ncbi:MAG: hypothetical protein DMG80_05860 [Acidobacteria bacterium]|nr:MAG: hypothetical protein DMG80_05860 [Acidobacteriota bacterium]
MNNTTPGNPIIFLVFIVLTVIAIFGAKPAKWKLYNLLVILGACDIGIALGAVPVAFGGNSEISGHLAAAFMPIFGAAGAYVCMRRNSKRNAVLAPSAPVKP